MRTKPFFPDPQYFPSKPSSYFNYINMRILATCLAEQKCFCTNLPRKSSWNIASQSCTDYGNIQYSKRNYKPYFRHHVIYIWGLWQKSCHSRDELSDRWFCTVLARLSVETNSCQCRVARFLVAVELESSQLSTPAPCLILSWYSTEYSFSL